MKKLHQDMIYHDIKWFSSVTLIIAMMFTAVELFPLNLIANVGFIGWYIML